MEVRVAGGWRGDCRRRRFSASSPSSSQPRRNTQRAPTIVRASVTSLRSFELSPTSRAEVWIPTCVAERQKRLLKRAAKLTALIGLRFWERTSARASTRTFVCLKNPREVGGTS